MFLTAGRKIVNWRDGEKIMSQASVEVVKEFL